MYPGVFISLLVGMSWRDGVRNQKLALLAQDKGVYAADFGVWWEFSGVRARQFLGAADRAAAARRGKLPSSRETRITGGGAPRSPAKMRTGFWGG